jgi:uncharacterized repeat protein (TIGR01451 family)
MKIYSTYKPGHRTVRDVFFLLGIAVALGLGLALAAPALGAGLGSPSGQTTDGDITGTVTVTGGNAAGITVELRQRSNGGADTVLATATTNEQGIYHFTRQPSAPNDAFYYIKLFGGTGTLSAWYSFPIIYLSGSDFTVPSVEMADVQLLLPAGSIISLPSSLQWKARRSGETYRVFVYSEGKTDKAVLDSGSLGMNTEFPLVQGALPEGKYEAVVQVRDAVVGYGQSQTRFRFIVGQPPAAPPPAAPEQNTPAPAAPSVPQPQPQAQPSNGLDVGQAPEQPAQPAQPTQAPSSQNGQELSQPPAQQQPSTDPRGSGGSASSPSVQVNLSADRTQVQPGESIIYKIEVRNQSPVTAPGVVVTDNLPAGVTVNADTTRSSQGTVFIENNRVTAQVGDLPPNAVAVVEIPVSVSSTAGTSLSNQATAQHAASGDAISSNALVSEVAAPLTGPSESQPEAPAQTAPQTEPQAPAQQPAQTAPEAPAQVPEQAPSQAEAPSAPPANPPANPPASQPQQPSGSQPKSQVEAPAKSAPQAPAAKPPAATPNKQQSAPIPQTGGSFPVVLAALIVLVTLLARYLRGRHYRRV